jgi:hypothetical protein
MQKYSKQDEKSIKQFLESMYEKHQQIRGSGLAGGNGFTDFMHGFLTPMKQFGSLLNIVPGLGTAVTLGASGLDKLIPGHQYETVGDALSGKHIQGTGTGGGGKVGRPRKLKVEVSMIPVKRRGRPRKA